MFVYMYILAEKPTFGEFLCYGVPSTAFWRKHSDASVLSKAHIMSAMSMTESRAMEGHAHGNSVTVLQGNYVQGMHAYND